MSIHSTAQAKADVKVQHLVDHQPSVVSVSSLPQPPQAEPSLAALWEGQQMIAKVRQARAINLSCPSPALSLHTFPLALYIAYRMRPSLGRQWNTCCTSSVPASNGDLPSPHAHTPSPPPHTPTHTTPATPRCLPPPRRRYPAPQICRQPSAWQAARGEQRITCPVARDGHVKK